MHTSARLLSIACAAAVAAGAASAQTPQPPAAQPAARALAVAGSAFIERGGQRLPLQQGGTVENGDAVEVGDASAVQLRFSDESVVALRARSLFKVQDYRYTGNAEQDRSVFGLLRGGMRTITGLIGKANPRAYGVTNVLATVGIRGTHFTLVSCQDDCAVDGQPTANGLFGGVTDGRISVTNDAGETDFGQQEYFQVTSAGAPPQRLLAPPGVLNDRALVVRARAAAPATAAETTGSGSDSTQVSTSPQPAQLQLVAAATDAIRSATSAAERQSAVVPTVPPDGSGMLTIVRAGSERDTSGGSFPIAEFRNFTIAEAQQEIDEVRGKSFHDAASLAAQLANVRQVGSNAAYGVYWIYETPEPGKLLGSHFAFGDTPRVALPGSGTAVYNYAGGTSPTDNFDRTGAISAGRLGMDFAAQQVKTLDPITLQFFASASAPAVSYTVTTGNTWSMAGGPQNLSQITCTGCNGGTTGVVMGRLTGFDLQGYVAGLLLTGSLGKAQAHIMGVAATFGRQ